MRLNYVSNPPSDLSPEDQAIVERVKARRGVKGLIPLDLTLLHAPKVADGKSPFVQLRFIAITKASCVNRLQCSLRGSTNEDFTPRRHHRNSSLPYYARTRGLA